MTARIPPSDTPFVALTVAGTDSGGSAGIAADLKSFAANGVHGTFAVTVATAQNSTGISAVEVVPTAFLAAQIDAVTADFRVGATKTGLLYTSDAVEVVANRAGALGPLVVDPVLVSSAGVSMLNSSVAAAYITQLFPLAALITPNVAEAALLTGTAIDSIDAATNAARALLELGPESVLITGFMDHGRVVDILATASEVTALSNDAVTTSNVLGTGCSLSATSAAWLARGSSISEAVGQARSYVLDGLRGSANWKLGAGRGPIDHMARWPGLR